MNVKSFYGSVNGNNLVYQNTYPVEILNYLDREQNLLSQISKGYKVLVEIGCKSGGNLEWAVSHGFKYIGIDIVERYIEDTHELAEAKGLDSHNYELFFTGVEKLHALTTYSKILKSVDKREVLVLFPFNSFGSILDISSCISALRNANYDFIVFTFKNNKLAVEQRNEYYNTCNYQGVKTKWSPDGIRFISQDGLSTIAYSDTWFDSNLKFPGYNLRSIDFANIGIAYLSEKILWEL